MAANDLICVNFDCMQVVCLQSSMKTLDIEQRGEFMLDQWVYGAYEAVANEFPNSATRTGA